MRIRLATIAVVVLASLAVGCEADTRKSVEVEGPARITVHPTLLKATAVGGYPIFGQVVFEWSIDDTPDVQDEREVLERDVVVPDLDGNAISHFRWTPDKEHVGQKVEVGANALYLSPGSDTWEDSAYGNLFIEVVE